VQEERIKAYCCSGLEKQAHCENLQDKTETHNEERGHMEMVKIEKDIQPILYVIGISKSQVWEVLCVQVCFNS